MKKKLFLDFIMLVGTTFGLYFPLRPLEGYLITPMAKFSGFLLSFLYDVKVSGNIIIVNGSLKIEVIGRCTPLLLSLLLFSYIVIYSKRKPRDIVFLLFGVVFISLADCIRVVIMVAMIFMGISPVFSHAVSSYLVLMPSYALIFLLYKKKILR